MKRKKKEIRYKNYNFLYSGVEKNNKVVAWNTSTPKVQKYNRRSRIFKQEYNAHHDYNTTLNTRRIHFISMYVPDISKLNEKRKILID